MPLQGMLESYVEEESLVDFLTSKKTVKVKRWDFSNKLFSFLFSVKNIIKIYGNSYKMIFIVRRHD